MVVSWGSGDTVQSREIELSLNPDNSDPMAGIGGARIKATYSIPPGGTSTPIDFSTPEKIQEAMQLHPDVATLLFLSLPALGDIAAPTVASVSVPVAPAVDVAALQENLKQAREDHERTKARSKEQIAKLKEALSGFEKDKRDLNEQLEKQQAKLIAANEAAADKAAANEAALAEIKVALVAAEKATATLKTDAAKKDEEIQRLEAELETAKAAKVQDDGRGEDPPKAESIAEDSDESENSDFQTASEDENSGKDKDVTEEAEAVEAEAAQAKAKAAQFAEMQAKLNSLTQGMAEATKLQASVRAELDETRKQRGEILQQKMDADSREAGKDGDKVGLKILETKESSDKYDESEKIIIDEIWEAQEEGMPAQHYFDWQLAKKEDLNKKKPDLTLKKFAKDYKENLLNKGTLYYLQGSGNNITASANMDTPEPETTELEIYNLLKHKGGGKGDGKLLTKLILQHIKKTYPDIESVVLGPASGKLKNLYDEWKKEWEGNEWGQLLRVADNEQPDMPDDYRYKKGDEVDLKNPFLLPIDRGGQPKRRRDGGWFLIEEGGDTVQIYKCVKNENNKIKNVPKTEEQANAEGWTSKIATNPAKP